MRRGVMASARWTAPPIVREFLVEAHNGTSAAVGRINFRPAGGFQISSTDRFGGDALPITNNLRNGGGLLIENVTTGQSRRVIGAFSISTAYDYPTSTWWNIVHGLPASVGDIVRVTYWNDPVFPWDRAELGNPHRRVFKQAVSASGGYGSLWHWTHGPMISYSPDPADAEGVTWDSTTAPSLVGKTLKIRSDVDTNDIYSGTVTAIRSYGSSRLYVSLSPALTETRFADNTPVVIWFE